MKKTKILVIEDNIDSLVHLQEFLEECSFVVDIFDNATDAMARINLREYDLVVLDLNLPDFDGFEVLKMLNRKNYKIPTIITSAYSQTEIKLKAFKFGACDYMVKPIDPYELEARIWVHLGKNSKLSDSPSNSPLKIINGEIFYNNSLLNLTLTESKIIKILIENHPKSVSREDLCKILSIKSSHRTLDGHIKNIRKKLQSIDNNAKNILLTEYGYGYKLTKEYL